MAGTKGAKDGVIDRARYSMARIGAALRIGVKCTKLGLRVVLDRDGTCVCIRRTRRKLRLKLVPIEPFALKLSDETPCTILVLHGISIIEFHQVTNPVVANEPAISKILGKVVKDIGSVQSPIHTACVGHVKISPGLKAIVRVIYRRVCIHTKSRPLSSGKAIVVLLLLWLMGLKLLLVLV